MALTPDDLAVRSDDFDRVVLTRDRELAAEVLAEDYALVLVHPEPAVVPRSAWIEMLPDYVVHEWEVQEQKIEVRNDVGAVLQRIRMEATVLGQDRSGPFVVVGPVGAGRRRVAGLAPALHPAQRGTDARQRQLRPVCYFGGIRMPPSTRMVSAFM